LLHTVKMPRAIRRIALIYDARLAYDLKVMTGVAAYLQESGNYSVYIEENALKDQRLPDLRSWNGDGIVADFDHPAVAKAVAQSKLPVVGFGSGYGWYVQESSIPYFFTNNKAIATMAADHLLARGFRHFAYSGYAQTPINGWSEERKQAFGRHLNERGFSCEVYQPHYKTSHRWASVQRSLGKWLMSLPKPLGVMAANDNRARHVLEACRASGIRVPQDVAVIGVDNDELLCQLSSPPLSSVEQGAKRIGYNAAALLDQLMCGNKPPQGRFVIDPSGIIIRESTDVLAIDDPAVARAMAFIQEHAFDGINVPDVVSATAISRSGLETRFGRALGYTVRTAIRQVQLERARRLISDTNLPLKQVAANTGFRSVQHMTTLFGKAFGRSPAKYRETVVFSRPQVVPRFEG
jgi:LacI family transcriptional regulator